MTAEDEARAMLARMGVLRPLSSGDLVELANLLSVAGSVTPAMVTAVRDAVPYVPPIPWDEAYPRDDISRRKQEAATLATVADLLESLLRERARNSCAH